MKVTLAQYQLLTDAERSLVTHIDASITDVTDEDIERLKRWREDQTEKAVAELGQ